MADGLQAPDLPGHHHLVPAQLGHTAALRLPGNMPRHQHLATPTRTPLQRRPALRTARLEVELTVSNIKKALRTRFCVLRIFFEGTEAVR